MLQLVLQDLGKSRRVPCHLDDQPGDDGVWNTHGGDLLNCRVAQQNALHLDAGDVLVAADDHVLDAVTDLDIAVRVGYGGIAAVEPSIAHHRLPSPPDL